jgi:hypothetical protein
MSTLKAFAIALPLLLLPLTAAAVNVTLKWKYDHFPLKVELYDVSASARNEISETGSHPLSDKKAEVPFTTKWKSDSFQLRPGEAKPLVLVVKNESDRDRFFFATPHTIEPEAAALGHHFECLCNHSIYRVPAKSVWHRVVRLQVWRNYEFKRLSIEHAIVGVSQQDANGKYKDRLYVE